MEISELTRLWHLEFKEFHPEIEIPGSPERTQSRFVFFDKKNHQYLLEKIHPHDLERKIQIAETLDFLSNQKLSYLHPYLKSQNQKFLEKTPEGKIFQIRPYVKKEKLNRQTYTKDSLRGEKVALFILDLQEKGKNLPQNLKTNFNLPTFIHDFAHKLEHHNPEILKNIQFILKNLEENLFPKLNQIPQAFSHGDLHQENILWNKKNIMSIIDWEFSTFNHQFYDISHFIGCVGIDHPKNLESNLIKTFLKTLKENGPLSSTGWQNLKLFILASRLTWLSYWLLKKDTEMIEFEINYLHHIYSKQITDI